MRKNPDTNWSIGGGAMTLLVGGATAKTEPLLLNLLKKWCIIWRAEENTWFSSTATTASALGTNAACNVATLSRGENLRALDTRLRITCAICERQCSNERLDYRFIYMSVSEGGLTVINSLWICPHWSCQSRSKARKDRFHDCVDRLCLQTYSSALKTREGLVSMERFERSNYHPFPPLEVLKAGWWFR